jgi:hypothetical protein
MFICLSISGTTGFPSRREGGYSVQLPDEQLHRRGTTLNCAAPVPKHHRTPKGFECSSRRWQNKIQVTGLALHSSVSRIARRIVYSFQIIPISSSTISSRQGPAVTCNLSCDPFYSTRQFDMSSHDHSGQITSKSQ